MVISPKKFVFSHAFTLVETMIAMSIIIVFLGGAMTTILLATKSYRCISDHNELMAQERKMLDWLGNELRSTGFVLEAREKPTALILYRENLEETMRAQTNLEEAFTSVWLTNSVLFTNTVETNKHLFCLLHDPDRKTFSVLYEPDSDFIPDPENPVSNVVEKILLNNCEVLRFNLYQRNLIYSTNTPISLIPLLTNTLSSCQFIEVFWDCRKYRDEEKQEVSAELAGSTLIRLRK